MKNQSSHLWFKILAKLGLGLLCFLLSLSIISWLRTAPSPVIEVTDASYEEEIYQVKTYKPVLIWFVRAERRTLFKEELQAFEQIAREWSGRIKVVMIRWERLPAKSRILLKWKSSRDYTIVRDWQDRKLSGLPRSKDERFDNEHEHSTYLFTLNAITFAQLDKFIREFSRQCKSCSPRHQP